MKKILASLLVVTLFMMISDIPLSSEPVSDDPYQAYNAYRNSLFTLQKDIAQLYQELQEQKNLQAVYEHVLQATEKTAALIGKAEKVSYHVQDGFQGSLRGHLETLLEFGLSDEQENEFLNLGYTEEDIDEIVQSLAYYNDYYYHAAKEFTSEQIQWFTLMGLTDQQISELQTKIHDHYTQIHTCEEEVKEQKTELGELWTICV
jgi:septal ring factor EnvC (AmiA/AmiB activator)